MMNAACGMRFNIAWLKLAALVALATLVVLSAPRVVFATTAGAVSRAASNAPFFKYADSADSGNHGVEVEWMGTTGISQGWEGAGGREFRGMQSMRCCDFAAFMYHLADFSGDGKCSDSIELAGKDVSWVLSNISDCTPRTDHVAEIVWMIGSGISKGWTNMDGSSSFRPMVNMTREDMAAFLYCLMSIQDDWDRNKPLARGPEKVIFFNVKHGYFANHAAEVEWLASMGITKGWNMKDGTSQFRGTKTVARHDMASFMLRLSECMPKNDPLRRFEWLRRCPASSGRALGMDFSGVDTWHLGENMFKLTLMGGSCEVTVELVEGRS